jgi:hypothetical protein
MTRPEPGGSGSGGGQPPARRRLQDRIRDGLRRLPHQAQNGLRNLLGTRNRGPAPGLTTTQLEDLDDTDALLNPPRPPTPTPPNARTELSGPGSFREAGVDISTPRRPPPLPRRGAFLAQPPTFQSEPTPDTGDASRGRARFAIGNYIRETDSPSQTGSDSSQTGNEEEEEVRHQRISDMRIQREQASRGRYHGNEEHGRD